VIHKHVALLLITGSNFQLSTRAWIKFPHIMIKNGPCSLKCNDLGYVMIWGCDRWDISQFEIYFAVNEKQPWNLLRSVPLMWYKDNSEKNWFICSWMLNYHYKLKTKMWANAQRDGRPAEYRWRPLLNTAKFGWRPLLECRVVTRRCQYRRVQDLDAK